MKSKAPSPAEDRDEIPQPRPARRRKKPRAPSIPRARLTHFEIRRGATLLLRVAVADNALAEAGDELGALIKKISPVTRNTVVDPLPFEPHDPFEVEDFVVSQAHEEHDADYHEDLREHLVVLFDSLCDHALDDALKIVRDEQARRMAGEN